MAEPTSKDALARLAEQQHWITPEAEERVQGAVRSAFDVFGSNAGKVRDLLHGTWLHEPLHAIMTDVPVGSWTAAVLFDAIAALGGGEKLDNAADALVLLGLAGAAGAAVTGMNDWAEVKQESPRRIGAVHALLNIAATGFFVASAFARRGSRSRAQARSLAAVGFVIASASAHLGGNLVYEHGIGVEADKPWHASTRRDQNT